jgi:hypothetical protein
VRNIALGVESIGLPHVAALRATPCHGVSGGCGRRLRSGGFRFACLNGRSRRAFQLQDSPCQLVDLSLQLREFPPQMLNVILHLVRFAHALLG